MLSQSSERLCGTVSHAQRVANAASASYLITRLVSPGSTLRRDPAAYPRSRPSTWNTTHHRPPEATNRIHRIPVRYSTTQLPPPVPSISLGELLRLFREHFVRRLLDPRSDRRCRHLPKRPSSRIPSLDVRHDFLNIPLHGVSGPPRLRS